jgi:hypothetical protein
VDYLEGRFDRFATTCCAGGLGVISSSSTQSVGGGKRCPIASGPCWIAFQDDLKRRAKSVWGEMADWLCLVLALSQQPRLEFQWLVAQPE